MTFGYSTATKAVIALKKNTHHIILENTNAHRGWFAASGPNASANGTDKIRVQHSSIFMV